jgi:hypothetical protein
VFWLDRLTSLNRKCRHHLSNRVAKVSKRTLLSLSTLERELLFFPFLHDDGILSTIKKQQASLWQPLTMTTQNHQFVGAILVPVSDRATQLLTKEEWWTSSSSSSLNDDSSSVTATVGAGLLLKRCLRETNWTPEYALKVVKAYRQFMELKRVLEDWDAKILVPSGPGTSIVRAAIVLLGDERRLWSKVSHLFFYSLKLIKCGKCICSIQSIIATTAYCCVGEL